MISKTTIILLRSILLAWTITTQIVSVVGFSPGDVSSIAAAVAAAHIGKPPPFHSTNRRENNAKDTNDYSSCNYDMNNKFEVIGKAPRGHTPKNQQTTGTTSSTDHQFHRYDTKTIQAQEFSVNTSEHISNTFLYNALSTIYVVDDVNQEDFETVLCAKRNELDNFMSETTSAEKQQSHSNNINFHCDEDGVEDIPTVHAVFCGYKATIDELSRLRSAHVVQQYQ